MPRGGRVIRRVRFPHPEQCQYRQIIKINLYMENQTKQLPVVLAEPPHGSAAALWVDGKLVGVIQPPMVYGERINIVPHINRLLALHHVLDTSVCEDVNERFRYWDLQCTIPYKWGKTKHKAELTWVECLSWYLLYIYYEQSDCY